MYFKIDNELILEYTASSELNNNYIFFTGRDGNHIYDINYTPGEVEPDVYETPDEISVSNLLYNGKSVGKQRILDSFYSYTYDATKEHKSVVFTFKYEINEMPEQADYNYGQIHFSNTWCDNVIWPRNDYTFIKDDAYGYVQGLRPFSEPGMKEFEVGKLYITGGENSGCYYLYIKVDGVLLTEYVTANDYNNNCIFMTANNGLYIYDINFTPCGENHTLEHHNYKAATCMEMGNIEYYYCTNCEKRFSDSFGLNQVTEIELPKEHNLTYVEAVSSTCTTDGNIEYYYCNTCNKLFSDATCTYEYQLDELAIPKSHSLKYNKAKAETCTTDGNIAYYHCNSCGKNYTDSNGTNQVANVVVNKHHDLRLVSANETACTESSGMNYYTCTVCHKNYSDQYANNELSDDVISNNHNLEHHYYKAPTCEENGSIEYYHCLKCGKNFSDQNATILVTEIIISKQHNITKIEAKSATCITNGNIKYYTCTTCNKNYSDQYATNEIFDVEIIGEHSLVHFNATEATCTIDGNIEYYECLVCGKDYKDIDATIEVNDVFTKGRHKLSRVAKVESTCLVPGIAEHWTCSVCNRNYTDASCKEEVYNLALPLTDHEFSEDGKCINCGITNSQNDQMTQLLSQFGCQSSISSCAIIGMIGLTLAIVIKKKKQEELIREE